MSNALIEKWNSKIIERDEIYILKNFASKENDILETLKSKMYLIRGNHEKIPRLIKPI
jgi:calcineurin-like phosphoesterase family protein